LYRLPRDFRDAVAGLVEVGSAARRWVATEELRMDEWQFENGERVLREVSALARRGGTSNATFGTGGRSDEGSIIDPLAVPGSLQPVDEVRRDDRHASLGACRRDLVRRLFCLLSVVARLRLGGRHGLCGSRRGDWRLDGGSTTARPRTPDRSHGGRSYRITCAGIFRAHCPNVRRLTQPGGGVRERRGKAARCGAAQRGCGGGHRQYSCQASRPSVSQRSCPRLLGCQPTRSRRSPASP
jgi:hypothetical protein